MSRVGKLLGYEENVYEKKDADGKVLSSSTYRYIHVVYAEEVPNVFGTAVARLPLDYSFRLDPKTLKIGSDYDIVTYFDQTYKVTKCNALYHLKG